MATFSMMPLVPPESVAVAIAATAVIATLGWAHLRFSAARGLAISTELGALLAPGESVHRNLHSFAEALRRHYGADSCLLIMDDVLGSAPRLYQADGGRAKSPSGEPLPAAMADLLLAIPEGRLVLYRQALLPGWPASCRAYEPRRVESGVGDAAALHGLASLLEAKSFLSVPLQSRERPLGRVHLVSRRRRYRLRELRSLFELMEQAGPRIEYMHLVERLSSTVRTHERRRISLDLHDCTVQPYIGLKLGLEALRRRLDSGGDGVAVELDELIRMAGDGIAELRHYVGSLKDQHARQRHSESIIQGVRYQARKFGELYGVRTEVVSEGDLVVPARLFDEIMHVVREGLSNIRRHTDAVNAAIALRVEDKTLVLEICNDRAPSEPAVPTFRPVAIEERVRDLGGSVSVAGGANGAMIVAVRVPL
jgi:signal transduction histidine kinase